MANYITDISLPEGIKTNARVVFIINNGEVITGNIVETSDGRYFLTACHLFHKIGLVDKDEFFKGIVGPENTSTGIWPFVKGKDNLRKILRALCDYRADRIPESEKVVISDDEKKPFTLSIRRKKGSTLNFKI